MLKQKNKKLLILLVSVLIMFSGCDKKETEITLGRFDPSKVSFNSYSSALSMNTESLNQVLKTAVYTVTPTIEHDLWETLKMTYANGEILYIGFSYLTDKMYAFWDNTQYLVEQYDELYLFLCEYMDKDEFRPMGLRHGLRDDVIILADGDKVYPGGKYYQKRYFFNNANENPNYSLGHTEVVEYEDNVSSRMNTTEEELAKIAAEICGLADFCAFTFKDIYTDYTLVEIYARTTENGISMVVGEAKYVVFNEFGQCLYLLGL